MRRPREDPRGTPRDGVGVAGAGLDAGGTREPTAKPAAERAAARRPPPGEHRKPEAKETRNEHLLERKCSVFRSEGTRSGVRERAEKAGRAGTGRRPRPAPRAGRRGTAGGTRGVGVPAGKHRRAGFPKKKKTPGKHQH